MGAKVFGRPPGSSRVPWVRLTQIDVQDVGHQLEHLTDHLLQLDCYAGDDATVQEAGQATATDLARACRQALHDLQGTTYSSLHVSSVAFVGMGRVADTDMEPAQERVILRTEIRVHP